MNDVTYITAIPINYNLSCQFRYKNCLIETAPDLSGFGKPKEEVGVSGYIIISIDTTVKDFETVADASIHARPMLLIGLNILSLFLERPLTTSDSNFVTSQLTRETKVNEIPQTRFVLVDEDLSDSLRVFIECLDKADQERQRLFYSLMDRWRKAFYLESRSGDSQSYNDEAVIAYFHVLELLAKEYKEELKKKIKRQIDNSLSKIVSARGSTYFLINCSAVALRPK